MVTPMVAMVPSILMWVQAAKSGPVCTCVVPYLSQTLTVWLSSAAQLCSCALLAFSVYVAIETANAVSHH